MEFAPPRPARTIHYFWIYWNWCLGNPFSECNPELVSPFARSSSKLSSLPRAWASLAFFRHSLPPWQSLPRTGQSALRPKARRHRFSFFLLLCLVASGSSAAAFALSKLAGRPQGPAQGFRAFPSGWFSLKPPRRSAACKKAAGSSGGALSAAF